MREMKNSGIKWVGRIPKNWEIHPLYFYFDERKNKNKRGLESNLLSLSYGSIIRKDIHSNGGLLPENFNSYNIVETNDIIFRPTDLQNDKKSLRTGLVLEHGIITSAYIDLCPKENVNSEYFHYLLRIYDLMKVFYNMGNGVRQGLNYTEFSRLMVFSPSEIEQDKIVKYLNAKCSSIVALQSNIKEQIGILEEYKKSIITEAVTKGLNPNVEMKDSGIKWIGNIRSDYQIAKLGLFCFVTKLAGFEYTDLMCKVLSDEGDVPIVRAQNVRMLKDNFESISEYIDAETSHKLSRCALDKKCVLITFIGAGIGDVCLFEKKQRHHLAPNVAKIEIIIKERLQEEYLMYYLGSYAGYGEINKISKASAQPSLSMETIRGIKVVLPSIEEQAIIVKFLKEKCIEIDGVIEEKKKQLEILEKYKKAIIYEYVTGKKEVPTDNG